MPLLRNTAVFPCSGWSIQSCWIFWSSTGYSTQLPNRTITGIPTKMFFLLGLAPNTNLLFHKCLLSALNITWQNCHGLVYQYGDLEQQSIIISSDVENYTRTLGKTKLPTILTLVSSIQQLEIECCLVVPVARSKITCSQNDMTRVNTSKHFHDLSHIITTIRFSCTQETLIPQSTCFTLWLRESDTTGKIFQSSSVSTTKRHVLLSYALGLSSAVGV